MRAEEGWPLAVSTSSRPCTLDSACLASRLTRVCGWRMAGSALGKHAANACEYAATHANSRAGNRHILAARNTRRSASFETHIGGLKLRVSARLFVTECHGFDDRPGALPACQLRHVYGRPDCDKCRMPCPP